MSTRNASDFHDEYDLDVAKEKFRFLRQMSFRGLGGEGNLPRQSRVTHKIFT